MSGGHRQTYAIVGGGVAGATAALTLRKDGFDGRVLLISDEDHPPYNRPPLSKAVVRGELEPERTHLRPARIWERQGIELLLGRAATGLDPDARALTLDDGEIVRYDELLLATGGRARTMPGVVGCDGIHTLRTIDDAVALREMLRSGASIAIVGAGFIGAELAASAVQMGCAATVLEAAPLPLSRVLPPVLGEWYARLHRERGVDLRLNAAVTQIDFDARGVRLSTADGEVEAAAVVIAVGLEPDVALARAAGLAVDDGIVVDECCRTSAPHVYAAGDVANQASPTLGRRLRVEHWQNAQHQAAAAARSMYGRAAAFSEVPWVWSDQYELKLEIAGFPQPDDEVVLRGDPQASELTALLLRDGLLAAAVGINRSDDVRAAREAIARGAAPPSESLRDLDLDLADVLRGPDDARRAPAAASVGDHE